MRYYITKEDLDKALALVAPHLTLEEGLPFLQHMQACVVPVEEEKEAHK